MTTERYKQGLCHSCNQPREETSVRCTSCRERERALNARRDKTIPIPIPQDVIERFWASVPKRPSEPSACWEWSGALDYKGYGAISVVGARRRTHRISYMIAYGAIEPGLCVCHKCDNRKCVRPTHFFLGTSEENTQDMFRKGRYVPPSGVKTTGELNWQAKLTDAHVIEIRRRIRAGEKGRDLARLLGVSEATISEAKNGRLWDHITEEPPLKPWSRQ